MRYFSRFSLSLVQIYLLEMFSFCIYEIFLRVFFFWPDISFQVLSSFLSGAEDILFSSWYGYHQCQSSRYIEDNLPLNFDISSVVFLF